jgi:hypothetical protein
VLTAALKELDPAIIVPLRPGGAPDALLLLAAKRSGDIYTPTDLTLLGSVAHVVTDQYSGILATA